MIGRSPAAVSSSNPGWMWNLICARAALYMCCPTGAVTQRPFAHSFLRPASFPLACAFLSMPWWIGSAGSLVAVQNLSLDR